MAINRGTFTFTFLFDDEIDSIEFVRNLSIDQILGNCDTEHMVGHTSGPLTIVEVPKDEVGPALLEMGSDADFFRLDDEGEDD